MLFSEVIGQEEIKKRLIHSVLENRISHAQLFVGLEGSGNLALAMAYAQFICCLKRSETDSCGECSSCKKYQKLIHPDLHFVYPIAATKKVSTDFLALWRTTVLGNPYMNLNFWVTASANEENKQAGILSEEAGEIIRKLSLKTYEAEYKIMIIWMPERMNVSTSNKLLKILEEPPSKTLFLLVAQNTEEMLQTILSRTQLLKIPRIDDKSLANHLKKNNNISEEETENIINMANGNYLQAMEVIKSSEENKENLDLFQLLMRYCFQFRTPSSQLAPSEMAKVEKNYTDLVHWVDDISRFGREKQKRFISYSLRIIRENFMLNLFTDSNEKIVFLNKPEKAFSDKFKSFINSANVFRINEEFNNAYSDIERNGSGKIIFMDLALKIARCLRIK